MKKRWRIVNKNVRLIDREKVLKILSEVSESEFDSYREIDLSGCGHAESGERIKILTIDGMELSGYVNYRSKQGGFYIYSNRNTIDIEKNAEIINPRIIIAIERANDWFNYRTNWVIDAPRLNKVSGISYSTKKLRDDVIQSLKKCAESWNKALEKKRIEDEELVRISNLKFECNNCFA